VKDPSWLINALVIAAMAYLTFVMALAGWFESLRKGQAVILTPAQGSRSRNLWINLAIVALSLAISVVLMYILWIPTGTRLSAPVAQACMAVGLLLFAAGFLLVTWARTVLGRMWGISTSREVRLQSDHQLITTGPYSIIRHPTYAGWWMTTLGLLLAYRTWFLLVLFALSIPVFARRARREEEALATRFGELWRSFAARAGMFLPRRSPGRPWCPHD
jgi:protein-S-isoprenylcysteine O-methyltransferase Ste14